MCWDDYVHYCMIIVSVVLRNVHEWASKPAGEFGTIKTVTACEGWATTTRDKLDSQRLIEEVQYN